MDYKSAAARVEIKDADKGTVDLVFSTLNVVDLDGDVTLKGALPDGAPAAISAYGHQSWKGRLPVGKGRIRETSTEGIFEGRFFLDTADGLDTFTVVKELSADDGPGQQWSYGLIDMVTERGDFQGQKVRFIKSVKVPEVSPVLVGAGVNTRTIEAKARSLKTPASKTEEALRDAGIDRYGGEDTYVYPLDHDPDEGWVIYSIYSDGETDRYVQVSYTLNDDGAAALADDDTDVEREVTYAPAKSHKFSEHVKSVVADVDVLYTRASEVVALRASKGKALGDESAAVLREFVESVKRFDPLLAAAPPTSDSDAVKEYLRYVALTQGVTT